MPSPSQGDPNANYIPPDPGGRSRYLIRGLAIAIILCVLVAAFMMYMLHRVTPPPTPQQQPQTNSQVVLPQRPERVATPSPSALPS